MQFFNHAEGYVSPKDINDYSAGFDYVYNYLDHLGNIRLSYTDSNGDGNVAANEIVEENNLYPFGMKHKGYNSNVSSLGNSTAKKYKYNGKELQDDLGLNMYDYGARMFDPSLGRWFGIDGMSEKYFENSPYHYANNNPVLNYDVDGNYFVDVTSLHIATSFQQNRRAQINKNKQSISDLQALVGSGVLSASSVSTINGLVSGLQGANSELQSSIDEVSTLISSSQGYSIVDAGASASSGHTTYDFSSGIVNIAAPLDGGGLLGHELKHAYQFDQGITSLAAPSGAQPINGDLLFADLHDELNSYKRQEAIEPGTSPFATISDIQSNPHYSRHPVGPLSYSNHAEVQKALKITDPRIRRAVLSRISKLYKSAFRSGSEGVSSRGPNQLKARTTQMPIKQ